VDPDDFEDTPRTLRGALLLARDVARSMRRAFAMLWATDARLTAAVGALSVVAAFLPAAMAYVAKAIVDGMVRASESGAAADRAAVYRYLALELGLALVGLAIRRAASVTESLLRARFAQHVNERIVEKALSLTLADFEDAPTLDRLNRARKGASYRPLDMVQGMFGLVQEVLTLAAYGGLMVSVSGWMQLLIVLAAVPEFVVQTRFSEDAFRLFHWRSPETRRQSYYEAVLTQAGAAKEVRLFELGPLLFDRYKEFFTRFWREDRDMTLRQGAWGFLLGLVSHLAFYGSYAWVAFRAMTGAVTLGGVGLFVAVFREAQGTVGSVLHTVSRSYEDHLYLTSLYEFLDHVPAATGSGTATSGPHPEDGIRFEAVSFAYPGADKPVLEDVTLHLPRGHKLALVGENGAGKTTLIKLLTRLYAHRAGASPSTASTSRRGTSPRCAAASASSSRTSCSTSLSSGRTSASATCGPSTTRRVARGGRAGHGDEVIESLPKGYHTQLGKWFEDGRELSLGQWQKVALSRAFMRRDADILVLDEPTASMDAEAEAQVFARFRALTEHRSAVLISHRFSTVRMADTIAVLPSTGKIIEQGTHAELLERAGATPSSSSSRPVPLEPGRGVVREEAPSPRPRWRRGRVVVLGGLHRLVEPPRRPRPCGPRRGPAR
jgi:ATP-binding cassette subfamily B protein